MHRSTGSSLFGGRTAQAVWKKAFQAILALNRIKARTTAGMALQDLAQATLDKRITAEQFTELVVKGKLFPELGFLLGTVKVEDGISSDTKVAHFEGLPA